MAKKWPGMVVQRTFIKEDSFVYRLYMYFSKFEKLGRKNHIMFVAFNVHAHFYCAVVSDRDHFLRNN